MRRLYFSSERGWSPDPAAAMVRIDCDLRSSSRNSIYQRGAGGDWRLCQEPEQLSALHRGWVWRVRQAGSGSARFLAFRGIAFVDSALIAGPLAGLELHAPGGSPLANPLNAGEEFWLDPQAAKLFAARIRAAGGEINREQDRSPLPSIGRLEQASGQIRSLLVADDAAFGKAQRGDLTVVPEFEARGPRLRGLVETARESARVLTEQIETASSALAPDQLDAAIRLGEQVKLTLTDCERALIARRRIEDQMTKLQKAAPRSIRRSDAEIDIPLRIMLRDLEESWTGLGFDCELQGDRLTVDLDSGRMTVAREPHFDRIDRPAEGA